LKVDEQCRNAVEKCYKNRIEKISRSKTTKEGSRFGNKGKKSGISYEISNTDKTMRSRKMGLAK